MAREVIDTTPGAGDTAHEGGEKINRMTLEIYDWLNRLESRTLTSGPAPTPTPTPGPTPTPTPGPTPTPSGSPTYSILVGQGDSITAPRNTWFDQLMLTVPSGVTGYLRAQSSRRIGKLSDLDTGENFLMSHVTEDVTNYGAQLIVISPFLTNDFGDGNAYNATGGAARAADVKAALKVYFGKVREKGTKLAFGFAPPMRSNYNDADATANKQTRIAFAAGFRDPAVWGEYCDYYIPVGEQPELNAADNTIYFPDGTNGTVDDPIHYNLAGQALLLSVNKPALNTILDTSRVTSTKVYARVWPAGQTGLAPNSETLVRIVLDGLAHKGIALGGSSGNAIAVSAGGQVRINGGQFAQGLSGWAYNGDAVDLKATAPATTNTDFSVNLTLGSETRTIAFKTASGGQVAYRHGGIAGVMPDEVVPQTVHNFPARTFAASGTGTIVVQAKGTPSSVRVGGVQATSRGSISGMYGDIILTAWTVPIDISTGADRDIVVTYPGGVFKTTLAWGTVTGANPVPSSVATDATNGGDPHGPGPLDLAAGGLALGYFGETGGDATGHAVVQAGTAVAQGWGLLRQGERQGINLAKRTDDGPIAWTFGYAPYPSLVLLFDPA